MVHNSPSVCSVLVCQTCVCPGLPGAPPFEARSFPTVSFQRCCRPTGAGPGTKPANREPAVGLTDSAVGPSTSLVRFDKSERRKNIKRAHSVGVLGGQFMSEVWSHSVKPEQHRHKSLVQYTQIHCSYVMELENLFLNVGLSYRRLCLLSFNLG